MNKKKRTRRNDKDGTSSDTATVRPSPESVTAFVVMSAWVLAFACLLTCFVSTHVALLSFGELTDATPVLTQLAWR